MLSEFGERIADHTLDPLTCLSTVLQPAGLGFFSAQASTSSDCQSTTLAPSYHAASLPQYLSKQLSISSSVPALLSDSTGNSSSDSASLASVPSVSSSHRSSDAAHQSPMIIDPSEPPGGTRQDTHDRVDPTSTSSPQVFALQPTKRDPDATFTLPDSKTLLPIPRPPELEEMMVKRGGSPGQFPFPQMPVSPKDTSRSLEDGASSTLGRPSLDVTMGSSSYLGRAWESVYDTKSAGLQRDDMMGNVRERSQSAHQPISHRLNPFQQQHQQQQHLPQALYHSQPNQPPNSQYPTHHLPHSTSLPAAPTQVPPYYQFSSFQPSTQCHHLQSSTSYAPPLGPSSANAFHAPPSHPPPPPQPQPIQHHPGSVHSIPLSSSSSSSKRRKVSAPESSSSLPKAAKPLSASASKSSKTTPLLKHAPNPSSLAGRSSPKTRKVKREFTGSPSPEGALRTGLTAAPLEENDEYYIPPLPTDFGEYAPGASSSARFDSFVGSGDLDEDELDEVTTAGKGKKRKAPTAGDVAAAKANAEADFSGKDSYWGVGKEVYEGLSPKSRKQLRYVPLSPPITSDIYPCLAPQYLTILTSSFGP